MSTNEEIPDDVPFSLICEECDAGMDIVSRDQALAEGWTEIIFDANGLSANFVGLCPDCRRAEEECDSEKGLPQT